MKTDNGTYEFPAYNLETLQEEVNRMNRRAAKLGVEPVVIRLVREFEIEKTTYRNGLEIKSTQKRVEVEVLGETPKFEGWSLVAAIERQENGENLLRAVPGKTVPEAYRTTDSHCDHCQSDRRRKEVFILAHEDGRFAQVGRQCIADFLGHGSVDNMVAKATWTFDIDKLCGEADDENFRTGGGEWRRDITEFLAATCIVIRRLGWVSNKMAREQSNDSQATWSTSNIAWRILTDNSKFMREFVVEKQLRSEERDYELAAAALEWARSQPTTGVEDYLYNLGVACRQNNVNWKSIGIVASAVSAYLRHLDRIEELNIQRKKNLERKHVGVIGERQGFANVEIKRLRYFDGDFGVRTMVQFETEEGNVLVWWASKELKWKEGDKLDITGTVDKHDKYNECPQTLLKRVAEGLPKPKKTRKVQGNAA